MYDSADHFLYGLTFLYCNSKLTALGIFFFTVTKSIDICKVNVNRKSSHTRHQFVNTPSDDHVSDITFFLFTAVKKNLI